jgi:hypothetical protein
VLPLQQASTARRMSPRAVAATSADALQSVMMRGKKATAFNFFIRNFND